MKWRESKLCVDLNESKLNVREDNDKLFEIVPKLFIEPDEDFKEQHPEEAPFGKKAVRVIAASTGASGSGNRFGVAMNSDLLVLNSTLDIVENQIEFGATIDFVLWRRSILLVGLASSSILLLNPDTFETSESRNVSTTEKRDRFFVDAFLHANPDPTKIDLMAVGVDGVVYTFTDVSLSTGSLDFTVDENCSVDIDVATIKGSAKRCLHQGVQVLAACSSGRRYMFTADDTMRLSVFSVLEETDLNHDERYYSSTSIDLMLGIPKADSCVKKVRQFEGILFVLLSNGRLEFILDEELIGVGKFTLASSNLIVQDFEIVIMNVDVIKLWVLLSDLKENDHFIGIAPAPQFNMEFVVRIPSISDGDSFETTFRFPSSTAPFEEPNVFIETMPDGSTKLYQMEEYSTDISLQNLLLKGKFDKAELLAKRYEKDVDLVWKAKVAAKYVELIASSVEAARLDIFEEIKDILICIQDAQFVCGFGIDSAMPRLDWMKTLIEIGMKRVGECSGSQNGKRLLQIVKKFYTFQQVLPEGRIEEWNAFNSESTSMFLQCVDFLQKLQFTECEIIWLRHCDEFLPDVDLSSFVPFFKKLFWQRLCSDKELSLLKTIFPFALEKCVSEAAAESQSRVSGLLLLVTNQVRALEGETQWPDEAMRFISILLAVVEEEWLKLQEQMDEAEEPIIYQRISICKDILQRLEAILQALRELKQLKYGHKIRMHFDKYITESKLDVLNTMLGFLYAKDELEFFIKDFLIPFAERNALKVDQIIEQHITMVASAISYFTMSASIPFEERVGTLVEFIESPLIRLECILRLAKEWPVPWHPLIEDIVKRAIRMSVNGCPVAANLQKTIQIIHTQVPFRCLMLKYKLSASKLTVGCNVVHTVMRILRSNKDKCYEDCLELIKHTGMCDAEGVRRIKFWNDLSETVAPLEKVLSGDLTPNLIRRFLDRILEQFRQAPDLYNRDIEPWDRYTACALILANRIEDERAIQFFKLRGILTNVWSDDIVHSKDYPFSALQAILDEKHGEPAHVLIQYCHRLSNISFTYLKDILVTAGSFFCEDTNHASALTKIWEFVAEVVRLPGLCHTTGDIVPYAGLRIAHRLALSAPTTPAFQLEMLQDFNKTLFHSYETVVTELITKLMFIISVFQELREREIPLEKDFLSIYKEVWREGRKGVPALLDELRVLGESLLRFGDTDLFSQIFNAVKQEYLNQSGIEIGTREQGLLDGANKVDELKLNLLQLKENFEVVEKNQRVVNLVTSLQAAGFALNSYSLRQRSKSGLIRKLVEMKLFQLASQTALVFDYRDGPSWSKILTEYIRESTISELKTLLESLKRISELWVIPEFKEAWLKVSEKHPTFRHMCPIPLGN